jgi:hypothetical protein
MADPSSRSSPPARAGRRETAIATVLVVCVALVVFWELMSSHSRREQEAFAFTAESFANFALASPAWSVQPIPVAPDPLEPNILAYAVTPRGDATGARAVLLRLVHGYNMVDCMRIKGESVDLIADSRENDLSEGGGPPAAFANLPSTLDPRPLPLPPNRQLWRLTSPSGRVSIWASAMLAAHDFQPTSRDTRSMPFPRVGTPDSPDWLPQGLTWKSLRNPIRNGHLFLRAKWNSSRADLLTFLGLRQPAWASDEVLTLVATSLATTIPPDGEADTARDVLAAHTLLADALRNWSAKRTSAREGGGS